LNNKWGDAEILGIVKFLALLRLWGAPHKRRTAATMAARSGDPFAVQRLLGHANLLMATRYVQDVSKQTDAVVEKSRKYMIQ